MIVGSAEKMDSWHTGIRIGCNIFQVVAAHKHETVFCRPNSGGRKKSDLAIRTNYTWKIFAEGKPGHQGQLGHSRVMIGMLTLSNGILTDGVKTYQKMNVAQAAKDYLQNYLKRLKTGSQLATGYAMSGSFLPTSDPANMDPGMDTSPGI